VIKFPKFTREENLNCKLSDKQIEGINKMRLAGFSYRVIATEYEVAVGTAYYWCLTETERKFRNRRQVILRGNKPVHCSMKKVYQRHLNLHPDIFKKYTKEHRVTAKIKGLSKKEYAKQYYLKNKSKFKKTKEKE